MARIRPILLLAALALIAACAPPDRRGAIQPAPPGPIDLVRSIWGDNSGRCPREYQYCGEFADGVCCPFERGCCEDARGTYCCSRGDRDVYGDRYERTDDAYAAGGGAGVGCPNTDITCSHEGRTICCDASDSCCAGTDGPYCCAVESRDRGRRAY
jgi:hypothetical protein